MDKVEMVDKEGEAINKKVKMVITIKHHYKMLR
jgi:hypothetical protein